MKLDEMNADQLRKYIKELREENRTYRERNETYDEVLAVFDEAQQRGLLHMIKTLGDDPRQGALLFRELADNIMEDTQEEQGEEEIEMTESNEQPDIAKLVAEAVAQALDARDQQFTEQRSKQEQEEFEAAVAYWDGEAKKLGYEPGSKEASDLFYMAQRLDTDDLAKAHEQLQKFNTFLEGGDERKKKEEKEEVEFPKSAGKGAGSPGPEAEQIDFKDDKAIRDAVFALVNQDIES